MCLLAVYFGVYFIYLIHLFKCTVLWILAKVYICITISLIKIENTSSMLQNSHVPPCLASPLTYLHTLAVTDLIYFPCCSAISRMSYKWNPSVCCLLNLASFTEHKSSILLHIKEFVAFYCCEKKKVLVSQSRLTLSTPWTLACQALLSMEFPRQEY